MKRILLSLLTLLLLSAGQTRASHIMGGEITYTIVSPGVYNLKLSIYRDCAGIPAANYELITATSASCGANQSINVYPTSSSPNQILTNCSSVSNTCNGGIYTGIERWDYEGQITLQACNDWILTYSSCCRNAAVTNLQNASQYGATFSANLNTLDAPVNNSPQFGNIPTFILGQGYTQTHNNGAFDPDGDSISVELTSALDDAGNAIPYSSGFSYLNPIASSTPFTVDPFTGDITVTPANPEVDVIAYVVKEYRNGLLIGQMTRDLQLQVVSTANHLPSISGINGTTSFVANVCSNDTLHFSITGSDPDAGDSVFIEVQGRDATGLTASSVASAGYCTTTIDWIPNISHVRSRPYLVYVKVYDNSCPYVGAQTYVFQVYVNSCSAEVWPGDANSDLVCDMYDVLPIGLAYGAIGPVRPNASLLWVAQPMNDWGQTFTSGIDYKHADCNGDGVIDAADTTAITLHYGQNHPFRHVNPVSGINSVDNFTMVASMDTAGSNDHILVEARLGSNVAQISNLYGIAFRVNFLSSVVDSTASNFSFTNSWLGTPGNDLLTYVHPNWQQGSLDAVAIRTDHVPHSGDSTIAVFDVVIVDNVSVRTILNFSLSGVRGVYADGTIRYFVPVVDSVEIQDGPTGLASLTKNEISLYPNPANSSLTIRRSTGDAAKLIFRNVSGEIILTKNITGYTPIIDTQEIPAGIYSVQILSGKESVQKKLMIVR